MTLTLQPRPFANSLTCWHSTSPTGEDEVLIQPLPVGARLTAEEATRLAKYLAPHLVDAADIPMAEVDRTSADDGVDGTVGDDEDDAAPQAG